MKKIFLLILMGLMCATVFAQPNYMIPMKKDGTLELTGSYFYIQDDNGGFPSWLTNYSPKCRSITIIRPNHPISHCIKVTIDAIEMHPGLKPYSITPPDYLEIYDRASKSGSPMAHLTGGEGWGNSYTATNPDGAITLYLWSGKTLEKKGVTIEAYEIKRPPIVVNQSITVYRSNSSFSYGHFSPIDISHTGTFNLEKTIEGGVDVRDSTFKLQVNVIANPCEAIALSNKTITCGDDATLNASHADVLSRNWTASPDYTISNPNAASITVSPKQTTNFTVAMSYRSRPGIATSPTMNCQATAKVTVNPIKQSDTKSICETELGAGGTYTWHGQTFTFGANETDKTLQNVTTTDPNGCQILWENLSLHVDRIPKATRTIEACDSYVYGGVAYTESQTITETKDAPGCLCDSIVTLNLVINHSSAPSEFSETVNGSYTWNGQVYDQTGDYTQTLTNAHGCDSVVTLHLTINQATSSEIMESVCERFVITDKDGNPTTSTEGYSEFTTSGDHVYTIKNVAGADSVVTLHLTVNEPFNDAEEITVYRSNSPFSHGKFTGIDISTVGDVTPTPTITKAGQDGECDSTYTLTVHVVANPCEGTVTVPADGITCGEEVTLNATRDNVASYFWTADPTCTITDADKAVMKVSPKKNTTFTAQLSYYSVPGDNTSATQNCSVTAAVTVNPIEKTELEELSICSTDLTGGKYTWHGHEFTSADFNTEIEWLEEDPAGCNIHWQHLKLTVNTIYTHTENIEVYRADNASYTYKRFTGIDLRETGSTSYKVVVPAAGDKCDSTFNLNVTVVANPCEAVTMAPQTITCGQSAILNSEYAAGLTNIVSFSWSAVPAYTFADASVANITVSPKKTTDFTVTKTYYSILGDNTSDQMNCKATVKIIVNPMEITEAQDTTICETELDASRTFNWHGQNFVFGGTETEKTLTDKTETKENDCDITWSSLTVKLDKVPTGIRTVEACEYYTWEEKKDAEGNFMVYHADNNIDTIHKPAPGCACDSVITLNLTINQPVEIHKTVTACGSYTWPYLEPFTESGTYEIIHSGAASGDEGECERTYILELTIDQPGGTKTEMSACGDYKWHDVTYTESNTCYYEYPEGVAVGEEGNCHDVDTLVLTIYEEYKPEPEKVSACKTYSWPEDGQTYTETGTHTYTHKRGGQNGQCDTTYTLVLTIYDEFIPDPQEVSACETYHWAEDGNDYSEVGTHTYTHQRDGQNDQCDTVYKLELTIYPSYDFSTNPTFKADTLVTCDASMTLDDGQVVYSSNTYNVHYMTIHGCDSIVPKIVIFNRNLTPAQFSMECPVSFLHHLNYGECEYTFTEEELGEPTWQHFLEDYYNYHGGDFTVTHVPATPTFGLGTHTVTWKVTDPCGNFVTCEQTIVVDHLDCPNAFDNEGNEYESVWIDCDCWTTTNLKSETYSDGSAIPDIYTYVSAANPDANTNKNIYGHLYTWQAAIGTGALSTPEDGHVQGICPGGWYLPTDEQYTRLSQHGRDALRTADYWIDGGGNNSTGFSSLPAGSFDSSVQDYRGLGAEAHYWSTTMDNNQPQPNELKFLYYCSEPIFEPSETSGTGYSVRCVKKRIDRPNHGTPIIH